MTRESTGNLFGEPEQEAHGTPPDAPWLNACGRGFSKSSWARPMSSARSRFWARPAPQRQALVAYALGTARYRQDDACPLDRRARPERSSSRSPRSFRAFARFGPPSTRPGRAAAAIAGQSCSSTRSIASTRPSRMPCLAAVEDGTVSSDRGHDREPVVRGQRGLAFAVPRGGLAAAQSG